MNYLKLTPEKLSIEAISDQVVHDSCGAISFFVGTTRDNFEDKKVLSLEYEAYEPMAIKQMEQICHFIRKRWSDVVNIAVYHRLGLVPVREASVVIAISSPHRQTSLDAVSFAIEELKKLVPIWKKEKYELEESAWKENKESNEMKKRIKLNFASHLMAELTAIPRNLVQITADENEIKRRIKCFVEKKRLEIDLNNVADYTELQRPELSNVDYEMESTCARTNSVIIKQEDSACHLRVRRVKNPIGPQIRSEYLQTLDKLMSSNKKHGLKIKQEPGEHEDEICYESNLQFSLHNRLTQAEEHLNITVDNTKEVYQRIKDIENRLLYLESISPEYKHFLRERISTPRLTAIKTENSHSTQRKIFGLDELDSIIEQMKQNYSDEDDEKNPYPNNEPQAED